MQGDYIVAIGSNSVDEYYRVSGWPALGEKAVVKFMSNEIGGMIANCASIFAYLGGSIYLVDTLGDDSFTDHILHDLGRYGIKQDLLTFTRGPNGKCLIFSTEDGERTIFVVGGGKKYYIEPAQREILLGARYVYSSVRDFKNLNSYKDEVLSRRNLFFDVEPDSFSWPEDRSLLEKADILIFNEYGFAKLLSDHDESEQIQQFLDAGVSVIVITLGSKGAKLFSREGVYAEPGYKVDVVDTTGAGDTFNAFFMFGLISGWDYGTILKTANAAAAKSVTLFGPRSGIASLDDVIAFAKANYPTHGHIRGGSGLTDFGVR